MAQAIGSQISNVAMQTLEAVALTVMRNAISYVRIYKRTASAVMIGAT